MNNTRYVTSLEQACADLLAGLKKLITDKDGREYAGLSEGFSFVYEVSYDKGWPVAEVWIRPTGWDDGEIIQTTMEKLGNLWTHVGRGRIKIPRQIGFISGDICFQTQWGGKLKISAEGTADQHLYSLRWRLVYKPFRLFMSVFRYLY